MGLHPYYGNSVWPLDILPYRDNSEWIKMGLGIHYKLFALGVIHLTFSHTRGFFTGVKRRKIVFPEGSLHNFPVSISVLLLQFLCRAWQETKVVVNGFLKVWIKRISFSLHIPLSSSFSPTSLATELSIICVQCPWGVTLPSHLQWCHWYSTGLVLHPQWVPQTSHAPLRASPLIYAKYTYTQKGQHWVSGCNSPMLPISKDECHAI